MNRLEWRPLMKIEKGSCYLLMLWACVDARPHCFGVTPSDLDVTSPRYRCCLYLQRLANEFPYCLVSDSHLPTLYRPLGWHTCLRQCILHNSQAASPVLSSSGSRECSVALSIRKQSSASVQNFVVSKILTTHEHLPFATRPPSEGEEPVQTMTCLLDQRSRSWWGCHWPVVRRNSRLCCQLLWFWLAIYQFWKGPSRNILWMGARAADKVCEICNSHFPWTRGPSLRTLPFLLWRSRSRSVWTSASRKNQRQDESTIVLRCRWALRSGAESHPGPGRGCISSFRLGCSVVVGRVVLSVDVPGRLALEVTVRVGPANLFPGT